MITATWDDRTKSYTLSTTMPGTVTWWRTSNYPDGRYTFDPLGTGNPILDIMVPLETGVQVTWTASIGTEDESLTVVPPVQPLPVLSALVDPPLPTAVGVVVVSQREYEVVGRSVLYEVLDRTVPYIDYQPPSDISGELVFRFDHPGGPFPGPALAAFRDLIRSGMPLMLRTLCNGRVSTISFAPTGMEESHIGSGNHHGPDRDATLKYRLIEPLWGDRLRIAGRLWFEVPMEFATWADVPASVATWDALVAG